MFADAVLQTIAFRISNLSNLMGAAVEFIVPTLKRAKHLRRCLRAILNQTIRPLQVLVGTKAEDQESEAVLKEFESALPVRSVQARGVGVIGSMASCLAKTSEDFVALLDDDVEIPADWTARMVAHLNHMPQCAAAGGRDILLDHPEMRRSEALVEDVGAIHWYGRITGNHHRGGGSPREVDLLRGSNMLWRGDVLRRFGFETRLRGSGAQVNWELVLALQAKRARMCMFFDPSVEVLHHVAPRHDDDTLHRGGFSAQATEDVAFNETFAVAHHGRGSKRLAMLAWQMIVGTPLCPGLARLGEVLTLRRQNLVRRLVHTLKGRLSALFIS